MFRLLIGLIALVTSLFLGQQLLHSEENTTSSDTLPHRQQLQRAAWNSGAWLIVYLANGQEEHVAYEKILRPLEEKTFRGIELKVFAYEKVPDSLLRKYPLMLIGKKLPTLLVEHLNTLPAVHFDGTYAQLGTLKLDQQKDLLQLTYLPGYWQDTLPMHLIWGKEDAVIQAHLTERISNGIRSFLWSGWGYEAQRSGNVLQQGYFNDSTWVMDKQIHFEFPVSPEDSWQTKSAHLQAYDAAKAPTAAWLNTLDTTQLAIEKFTGFSPLSRLNIKLYPSVERKALRIKSMKQADLSDDGKVSHLVINDNFQGEEWGVHYQPWLKEALGQPYHPLYEQGLALQWVDNIRGSSWRSWVRSLAEADALPSFDLLFNEDERQSLTPLIGQLAAGAWVDYRLQTQEKDAFLTEYKKGMPQPKGEVHKSWIKWIKETYPLRSVSAKPVPQQRLNGFTLAHEGYRIYNGYGSARARQSLGVMKQVGIEAVAIVPYSYMADAHRPDPIPVSQNAGGENDEAVLFAHLSAQSLGQFTLLKPQVWLGGGSWPGDVTFEREQDWQSFFTNYGRWALHYALLAEMYGFDAYCIGTELRYTTLKKPAEWRKLTQSIRKIYHGSLTYAANWGEECEALTFWDAFDFIGINCYYPLHKSDTATDAELAEGAEQVVEKMEAIAKRSGRPVWLTEIGFRSATAPWQQPHAEAGDRPIDNQAQARAYAAMLAACEGQDWLRGFFWWKWSCDLDHNENQGRGYTPFGKPAEEVLSRYYLNNG